MADHQRGGAVEDDAIGLELTVHRGAPARAARRRSACHTLRVGGSRVARWACAVALLAVIVLAGCGDDRREAPSAPAAAERSPSPSASPTATASEPAPEAAREGSPLAQPAPPPGVETDRVESSALELAIEPVEGGARAVVTVERGRVRYVLFRYDGAAVARSRIAAEPDGAFRLEVIEQAIGDCEADVDDYQLFDCAARVAPDPYLAASVFCAAQGWGVAVLELRGNTYERLARRLLFALACNEGEVLGQEPALRARDPDGDGREELIAIIPVRLVRRDMGMTGHDEGVVAYVLDTSLRTQLRVTSHHSSENRDVAGTTTICRGGWRFTDVNGDGHDDVRVDARCRHDWQDEESGRSSRENERDRRDCPYDGERDEWVCAPPIAEWLFTGGIDGVVGETPEDVRAALSLGAGLPAALERARARDAELEEGGAPATDPAPPERAPAAEAPPPAARPRCTFVVDDPAPPLRVRAGPSARAAIAGELANGTELELGERRGRWARIERPAVGWIWTANVRERCAE